MARAAEGLQRMKLRELWQKVISPDRQVEEIAHPEHLTRESQLRILAEHMLDLVYQLDAAGNYVYISPSHQSILGYDPVLLLGSSAYALVHPEDLPRLLAWPRQSLTTDVKKSEELRIRHADGHYLWIKVNGTVQRTVGNEFTGFIFCASDITTRMEAEEKFRLSEDKFFKAFHTAPDGLIITRLADGLIVEVNQGFSNISGYSPLELVGHTTHELNLYVEFSQRDDLVRQMQHNDEYLDFEITVRHKAGHTGTAHITGRTIDIRGERHILNIVRDITENKKADLALRESESRFRNLAQNSPDHIYLLDVNAHRLDYYNRQSFLGYHRSVLESTTLLIKYTHPDDLAQVSSHWQQVLDGSTPPSLEYRLKKLDGEWEWLQSREIILARNEDGKPAYLMVIITVITERKQVEQALRDSESKFRSIVESSPMGMHMYTLEEDGRLVFTGANPAADHILGLNHDQFTGATIEAAFPNLVNTEVPERYRRACLYGESWFTQQIVYKDSRVQGAFEVHAFQTAAGRMVAMFSEVTDRIRSEIELKRLNRALRTISECNLAMVRAQNEQELFQSICQVIVEQGGYRMVWIGTALMDSGKTIQPVAHAGYESGYLAAVSLSWADAQGGPTARSLHQRTPVVTADIQNDPTFQWSSQALERGYAASISFPLHFEGILFGNLNIYSSQVDFFDANEVALLSEMAGDLSFGIHTLRVRNQRVKAEERVQQANSDLALAYDATLEGWANALEMRERETAGHSRRVVELALKMAKMLATPEIELDHVRRGALLHDIGKMGIPDSILLKPGALSDEEWVIMHQHPIYAYNLLKDIPYLKQTLDIPYSHHERWDGSGYPQGLKGEQIPLAARIFAVIDVLDALTSDRPYRPAWNKKSAFQYLNDHAGKQFDPQVVAALNRLLKLEEGE
jgi:PAS domain S-box-containing protein/putative nucleotidyltransferase with HDIG domain